MAWRWLCRPGSRCWASTTGAGKSRRMPARSVDSASIPPAEEPTTTSCPVSLASPGTGGSALMDGPLSRRSRRRDLDLLEEATDLRRVLPRGGDAVQEPLLHRAIPLRPAPRRHALGQLRVLLERADGRPQRFLQAVLLQGQERLRAVGVADVAAEAQRSLLVHLPQRAMALRTGERRARAHAVHLVLVAGHPRHADLHLHLHRGLLLR